MSHCRSLVRPPHVLGRMLVACTVASCMVASGPMARAEHTASSTTITYWNMWTDPVQKGAMLKILHQFEQLHPGITVQEVDISSDQEILTAISGGRPPDAATLWNPSDLADWAARGALQSLQPLIAAAHMGLSDFNPSALGMAIYKGTIYGLPITQDGFSLYLNLDAFHAAGLTSYPRTMGALLADAVKLTKKDAAGRITQIGFDAHGITDLVPYFNGSWYDAHSNAVTPDSSGVLQALAWEKTWVDTVGVQPYENFITATPHNPILDHWIDGTEAMAIDGDWMCALTSSYNKSMHWTVTAPPYAGGHPEWANGTLVSGDLNVIPTGASHPNEAFALMQYMSSTEPQLQFNQAVGNTPTVKSADTLITNACVKTILQLEAGPRASYFPVLPVANQYYAGIMTAEDQVLRGKASPQQAMGRLKQTMQKALNAVQ
jgi:multiple sugar transport system substrate-binding protein